MKFYQLSELDLKELGINTDLITSRELLAAVDSTRVDVEVCFNRTLTEEEWEQIKNKYQMSDEMVGTSTAVNIFLQNNLNK